MWIDCPICDGEKYIKAPPTFFDRLTCMIPPTYYERCERCKGVGKVCANCQDYYCRCLHEKGIVENG